VGQRGYPSEFRCGVLDLVASGRKVSKAFALEIGEQTVYSWLRQDRIDRGLEPGLTTPEHAELRAAKRRIAELEAELAIHRRPRRTVGQGSGAKRRFEAIAVMAGEGLLMQAVTREGAGAVHQDRSQAPRR
jgi:transposase-like protein